MYNTHPIKYTDFWNITKRELIKKTQKVIFEDSQEFLQKLFDIAKKKAYIFINERHPDEDTNSATTDHHNTVYNYK